ncbi:hypothetical protein D3C85_535940 [compost metagenome]
MLDDLGVIRGAVHAEQVLEHVDRNIGAFLDQLGQVLAYHAAGEMLVEQLVEVFILFGIHLISCSQEKSSVKARSMVTR